ncbi:alpha/beta hydrolase [Granulicella sp. dw_53]|uniref:alpha/beta fold hydrolase n=1 Tax=Granulicella sp. dw_53 TaxID=2719792 RepID=UPI001BD51062|nr:alpha/beta hydrolase [Granulicella sp. dw_53]
MMNSRWKRVPKAMLGGLVVVLAAVALEYPLANLQRMPLDDAARQALIRSGDADHFVHLGLGTMHVREAGPQNGPVVLLVHGGVIGGYAWRQWQQPLTRAGFRVITPDLLGYGYSDRPKVPYTREFYTRQLTQLLDALKIVQPVHIVGASSGGAIVTAFAVDAPGRVRSVTLIAPAGGGRHSVVSDTLLLPVVGDWIFRVIGPRQVTGMMEKAYPPSAERNALVAWMRTQGSYRGFGEGLLNTLRNYDVLWQPEAYQALGRSGLPVLILWGTADTVNPFVQSRQIVAWVPQAQLMALPEKPHAITFGDAPLLLSHIQPFWKEHGSVQTDHR